MHSGKKWPFARIGAAVSRGVELLLGAVVEDSCVVCGRPPVDAPVTDLRPAPAALLGTVRVALLPGVTVRNHPICTMCAHDLIEARGPGLLRPPQTGPSQQQRSVPVFAPFMTNSAVLALVHEAKFRGYKALLAPMATAMAVWFARFAPDGFGDAIVCPVPMLKRDRRRRGFNQAEELGGVFARQLGMSLSCNALSKVRRTRAQSATPHAARAGNVEGAFAWHGCSPGDRPVILVDDIVTTGATSRACLAAVHRAGASAIAVVCFARSL